MRVMVIIKANQDSENGVMPSEGMMTRMMSFNEQLVKSGIMLAGEGLLPSVKGKRVRFEGTKKTVLDGPFTETKELVAGFWLWQVKSIEEAVEWVKRIPAPEEGEVGYGEVSDIEIRPVGEMQDLELTPEVREKWKELEAELESRKP
jgi:hypothetical protein